VNWNWKRRAGMNAPFDERTMERDRLSGELHDTMLQTVQASKIVADRTLGNPSVDIAERRRGNPAGAEGRRAVIY
jgi:signal transduction histidine kinase